MSRSPDVAARPTRRQRREAGIRARLGDANFASAIYGQILLLSVLAAVGVHEVSAPTVLATVVSSQLVFWLAHAYSQTLDRQLHSDTRIGRGGVVGIMAHEWPIAEAAGPTVVLMALAIAGVLDTATALDIAIGLAVVSLFGWGYAAGRRSGQTASGRLVAGALCGAFGLLIVALKLAIH